MKIAIVGHAKDKFTEFTEQLAKDIIFDIIERYDTSSTIISGGCPLGGIDIWAEGIAKELGYETKIYKPEVNQWSPPGKYGFMKRNIDIAGNCDVLFNIVIRDWPPNFKGERYKDYHCLDRLPKHVKSGGCWTAWRAKMMGKEVHWIIIDGEEIIV